MSEKALPAKGLASAVVVLSLCLVVACGGAPSTESHTIDAREALNMAGDQVGATSYHVTFRTTTEPEGIGGDTKWEAELQPPDRFRFFLHTKGQILEAIGIDGEGYGRYCGDVGIECGLWEGPYPVPPVASAGPSPSYMPGWPLVAAEMAGGLEVIKPGSSGQGGEIHIRGNVNHIRAVLEHQRRIFEEIGITTFGEECVNGSCRDLTFDEYLGTQSQLELYDENMAVMDAWIGRDGLINRMKFQIPSVAGGGAATVITVEYSMFGEIAIESPG